MTWETNPDFAQLPSISVKDIVHLRLSDGYSYLVKAIVSSASPGETIAATVAEIYDGFGQQLLIVDAKPKALIGTSVYFDRRFVHKVIQYAQHG